MSQELTEDDFEDFPLVCNEPLVKILPGMEVIYVGPHLKEFQGVSGTVKSRVVGYTDRCHVKWHDEDVVFMHQDKDLEVKYDKQESLFRFLGALLGASQ